MFQKKKRIIDKPYLDWIKTLPCLLCPCPSEPHHAPKKGDSIMGGKTDDTRALPLCNTHHREYHDTGRETFSRKHNIDYDLNIRLLNARYVDQLEAGTIQKRKRNPPWIMELLNRLKDTG